MTPISKPLLTALLLVPLAALHAAEAFAPALGDGPGGATTLLKTGPNAWILMAAEPVKTRAGAFTEEVNALPDPAILMTFGDLNGAKVLREWSVIGAPAGRVVQVDVSNNRLLLAKIKGTMISIF